MFSRASLIVLALLIGGCAKDKRFARIAVLPFENQSGDPRLDWLSRALPEALLYQMTGSPTTHSQRVESIRDAPSARPTHLLHGYFALFGGKLRVEAVLEDATSHRTARTASAEAGLEDPVAAADAVAAALGRRARPFDTRNPAAFRAYLDALAGGDPQSAAAAFERAVAADAGFGPAYLAWIQLLTAQGDREAARRVIAAARANSARVQAIERTRIELVAATVEGDRAAQRRVLETLSRLVPADPAAFHALAANRLLARDYASAIGGFRQALERDPENPALLNELGYAEAYAGHLEPAIEVLRRYQQARPREANPHDSLGDVHFMFGRFAEAEKYYLDSYRAAPASLGGGELYKAARARLMTGDLNAADALFAKFVQFRANRDPLIEYRRAEWEYLSGRRRQGLARLQAFVEKQATPRAAASLGWSQLAIWNLESGRRPEAVECASRAAALASSPVSAGLATVCRYLAQPPTGVVIPDQVRAYVLIISKDFKEAAVVLRGIYERTPPSSPEPIGVLLGWALLESGQDPDRLLAAYPLPEARTEQPFLCLTFPRVLSLRARWLERQGRTEEARADRQLYRKLADDLPTIFDR